MGTFRYKMPGGKRHAIEVTKAEGYTLMALVWIAATMLFTVIADFVFHLFGIHTWNYWQLLPLAGILAVLFCGRDK